MSEGEILCGPPGGTWRAERMMTEGTTKRFMFPSQVRAKMKPMVEERIQKGEDISYASSSTEELVEAILRSQAYYEFTGPEKLKEIWRLKVHRYCVNMAAEILRKKPQLRTRASKLRLRHASKPGTPGKPGETKDVVMGGTMVATGGAAGVGEGGAIVDPTMGTGTVENGTVGLAIEAADKVTDIAKVRQALGLAEAGTQGTGESAWAPANSWVAVNSSGNGNDSSSGSVAPSAGVTATAGETAAARPGVSALSHLLRLDEDSTRNLANSATAVLTTSRPAPAPPATATGVNLRELTDQELRGAFNETLEVMFERQLLPDIVAALVERNIFAAISDRLRTTQ